MSLKKYIVALDQGTTSSRAVIFDREQNIVGLAQREYTQYYPKEGWVEHDPMEIYASQYGVLIDALLSASQISGRLPLSGKKPRGALFIMLSSGSAAGLLLFAKS